SPQNSYSRRAPSLEHHLPCDRALAPFFAPRVLPCGGGTRRDFLLPRVRVDDQRLPSAAHTDAGAGPPPDQRVRRLRGRGLLCRPRRQTFRLALVVHCFRRVRRDLGSYVAACASRTGSRCRRIAVDKCFGNVVKTRAYFWTGLASHWREADRAAA